MLAVTQSLPFIPNPSDPAADCILAIPNRAGFMKKRKMCAKTAVLHASLMKGDNPLGIPSTEPVAMLVRTMFAVVSAILLITVEVSR